MTTRHRTPTGSSARSLASLSASLLASPSARSLASPPSRARAATSGRSRSTRLRVAGAALGSVALVALGPVTAAGAAVTEHTYQCTSAIGSSDTSYSIDATAPAEVVAGSSFSVDPVVVTGTPPVDLLLADITFGILVPDGATLTSPAEIHFDGPGSTDPPGPIAPAGEPNSSPPMTFSMTATGPVGSTITVYPAPVTSIVVDPADLSNRLAVGCSEIVATPIAVIAIVAAPPTTPPTTAPDGAAVLAADAAAAQAVETTPAVTG